MAILRLGIQKVGSTTLIPGHIDWHIHAGTVNNDADPATFWKDGVLRITGNRSFNNVWNKPGQIAAGGNWGERSNCEVARILLYGEN